MRDKMFATVKGTTSDGDPFEEELKFSLIPPRDGEAHYGTGCYMRVEMSNSGPQFEDVRYARTTDIEILADRFIKGWYGTNAKEVIKSFHVPPSLTHRS